MKPNTKTPLAWKNLTHDWRRLSVAVAGIAFAVLLMFIQVGFQNALFDSQVKIIDDLKGDIFIISRAKYTLAAEKRFPIARIHQARSCPGVSGAFPIYSELTTSVLKKIERGRGNKPSPIRSIGFYLDDPVFTSPEIHNQLALLRSPATVLIDKHSKVSKFPFLNDQETPLAEQRAELADQNVSLVGSFEMGTDFAHDGNLLMSAENFARYFPYHKRIGDPLSVVDIGVVHLHPGASLTDAHEWLVDHLANDVGIFTREDFRNNEVTFWDESTPIGVIFMAGTVIGFVVGMVICYQVIYSDITDHMPEFATLKAMGYSTGYFIRLIVVEAILLSLIGYVPGALVSKILYSMLASQTGLLMRMSPECLAMVFGLTLAMCIASGLLAVRKLLGADPASLF